MQTFTAQTTSTQSKQKPAAADGPSPSSLIGKKIADLGDWRAQTLSRRRSLIKIAASNVVEKWQWMSTPVWSHDGIICTVESNKFAVKLTFAKGASVVVPAKLFNAGLDGNTRHTTDIHEGEELDASAFKALICAAVDSNASVFKAKAKPSRSN